MTKKIALLLVIALTGIACAKQAPVVQNPTDCSAVERERDALAQENEKWKKLAEERQAIYDSLRESLQSLIDSGKLNIVFRRGMIVLQMPNKILFESGKDKLKGEGKETITSVGEALSEIDERRFLVAGHTDNQPIKASKWKSNWELSSARAQVVLKVLVTAGVSSDQLAAAGFAEFDPVGPNDSDEGMAANRRTEIMVVPNLEQIFDTVSE